MVTRLAVFLTDRLSLTAPSYILCYCFGICVSVRMYDICILRGGGRPPSGANKALFWCGWGIPPPPPPSRCSSRNTGPPPPGRPPSGWPAPPPAGRAFVIVDHALALLGGVPSISRRWARCSYSHGAPWMDASCPCLCPAGVAAPRAHPWWGMGRGTVRQLPPSLPNLHLATLVNPSVLAVPVASRTLCPCSAFGLSAVLLLFLWSLLTFPPLPPLLVLATTQWLPLLLGRASPLLPRSAYRGDVGSRYPAVLLPLSV